ncbi:MAG: 3-hydroxyacyl-CoA dehydrogenase family protein [Alphaproteobacteria bacterium]
MTDKNNQPSDKVGVIGAGQMGRGIAQVFASGGFQVVLCDVNAAVLDSAKKDILLSLKKLAEKNQLKQNVDDIFRLIEFCPKLDGIKHCQWVMEAILEDLTAKKNLYQELKNIFATSSDWVLASNTSSFLIRTLQNYSPNPKNFFGVHFMNPPALMPLVEIILTPLTDPTLGDMMKQMVEKKLAKQAVLVKDSSGFLLNRLLLPYLNEAVKLLDNNIASRDDIDKVMMLGAGYKMGPFALLDFIGLDICKTALDNMAQDTGYEHYRPCQLLCDLVEAGHLGRKSKKGFYDYQ